MDYQFRSALNGFNRSDVVVYLQNLTEAHKGALLDAQAEASRATEEAARLRDENRMLHMQLAELLARQREAKPAEPAPEEPEAPTLQQQELEAYRRAEAVERTAAEKAAAVEQAAAERAAALERQAAERAAALERETEEKLAATRQALNGILSSASARVSGEGAGLESLIASVSGELGELQSRLNAMTAFLTETAASLDALQK